MKKIIWLMKVILIIGMIAITPVDVKADTAQKDADEEVNVDDNGFAIKDGVLVEYIGTEDTVVIPNGISRIGNEAFKNNENLKEVIIPEGVIEIGDDAFLECTYLKKITLPDGLTVIGKRAFEEDRSLSDIEIPESVTNIGEDALMGTNITDIVLPDGLKEIEAGLFSMCDSLEKLKLPANLKSIGEGAFWWCSRLKEIELPEGIRYIDSSAFGHCTGLTDVKIPISVRNISSGAFKYCEGLTGVTIPEGVVSIGSGAFEKCLNLKTVSVPESLMEIGDDVFGDCNSDLNVSCYTDSCIESYLKDKGIKYILLPKQSREVIVDYDILDDGTASVTGCVFYDHTTVDIPGELDGRKVTSIADGAFKGCKILTSMTLPDTLTSIGKEAFLECTALKDIAFSINLTNIGERAFRASGLEHIEIPEGVKEIKYQTFLGCTSLTTAVLPESLLSIGEQSFSYCQLKNFTIPGTVQTIGVSAFSWTGIVDKELVIPESVMKIGNSAFFDCYMKVMILNSNCEIADSEYTLTDTICGYRGSTAETYAKKYGKKFLVYGEENDETPTQKVQTITASDIVKNLRETPFFIGAVTSGNGRLSYSSDNEAVAKVDASGQVVIVGVGTARITIDASATNEYLAAKKIITITVQEESKPISAIVTQKDQTIKADNIIKTYSTKAFYINASTNGGGKLTYYVADKKIAKINDRGLVTLKGYGETKITICAAANGDYKETKKVITLFVKPAKQTIVFAKSLKAKTVTIKWKRDRRASGYIVQYSTDKKFRKNVKSITLSSNKITYRKIKNLKAGTKYYIRMCSYKKLSGTVIRGDYSKLKLVKLKS